MHEALDSYFARTDTANPDSGDVHSPKRAFAQSVRTRLEGDETKPGSKLKNRREVSAPRRIGSAVLARWLISFNQPEGRAFAFYVVSSWFGRFRTASRWMHQIVEHQKL